MVQAQLGSAGVSGDVPQSGASADSTWGLWASTWNPWAAVTVGTWGRAGPPLMAAPGCCSEGADRGLGAGRGGIRAGSAGCLLKAWWAGRLAGWPLGIYTRVAGGGRAISVSPARLLCPHFSCPCSSLCLCICLSLVSQSLSAPPYLLPGHLFLKFLVKY